MKCIEYGQARTTLLLNYDYG